MIKNHILKNYSATVLDIDMQKSLAIVDSNCQNHELRTNKAAPRGVQIFT